jgi:hypothetical protein
VEAARRSYLTAGGGRRPDGAVRPPVLRSWDRCLRHGLDPDRLAPRLAGLAGGDLADECAQDAFAAFLAGNAQAGCCLALADGAGVIRVRRDGDEPLGRLLDAVGFVPGYSWAERDAGTTAIALALHERTGGRVDGAEHYHAPLSGLSAAAAVIADPLDGRVTGVVVVTCHVSAATPLQGPLARLLADAVASRVAAEPGRAARAVLARFLERARDDEWVLATDGEYVLTSAKVRQLDGHDARALSDLALATLVIGDGGRHPVQLPSGAGGEVAAEAVTVAGQVAGCVLTGGPADRPEAAAVPEAVRRQGSHVAPVTRRDYAAGLRAGDDDRRWWWCRPGRRRRSGPVSSRPAPLPRPWRRGRDRPVPSSDPPLCPGTAARPGPVAHVPTLTTGRAGGCPRIGRLPCPPPAAAARPTRIRDSCPRAARSRGHAAFWALCAPGGPASVTVDHSCGNPQARQSGTGRGAPCLFTCAYSRARALARANSPARLAWRAQGFTRVEEFTVIVSKPAFRLRHHDVRDSRPQ